MPLDPEPILDEPFAVLLDDEDFQAVAKSVSSRIELITDLILSSGCRTFLEIGVWRGELAELIL